MTKYDGNCKFLLYVDHNINLIGIIAFNKLDNQRGVSG